MVGAVLIAACFSYSSSDGISISALNGSIFLRLRIAHIFNIFEDVCNTFVWRQGWQFPLDHLQQMADHYDQSGARAIYRRGLANGDDA
jgi:hypothetical protein